MHVRILGAAAGGAFPQWNCSCPNCRRLRQGSLAGEPRSQTQLAVSADDRSWYLLNASPDLRYQIEAFPPLYPHNSSLRHSPIAGLILSSAEVDASLGLLLLRESQPLTVYATDAVRDILMSDNTVFQVLRRQTDQVRWVTLSSWTAVPLDESGIECLPVSTGGGFPGFVTEHRATELGAKGAVLGFFFSEGTRRFAFFPGVLDLKPEWLDQIRTCDVVFFDGTFWSDDELIRLQGHGQTARQMGHQPVADTLRLFDGISARKIFIHINNTNPILDEESREFQMVRDAGWEVAFDGMDLIL